MESVETQSCKAYHKPNNVWANLLDCGRIDDETQSDATYKWTVREDTVEDNLPSNAVQHTMNCT